MSRDWSETLADAKEAIEENGRPVILRKLGEAPSDSDTPWLGTPTSTDLPIAACFVGLLKGFRDDFLTDLENVALVAGDFDPNEYQQLLDNDGSLWRIIRVQTLKPGTVALIHYIGVAR